MSSAHNAIKLRSSPATSNLIQLEWICSIFRRSAAVSSSIDRTWIADAPIVLQDLKTPRKRPIFGDELVTSFLFLRRKAAHIGMWFEEK
jgi:hypothetical protein